MSDFDRTKKDYCSGRIKISGRTFLIEFWEDGHFGLPWCRISEVLISDIKPHWWSHKTEKREVYHYIDDGWVSGNRLKWAGKRINEYIQDEIDSFNERKQIEEFCNKHNE